MLVSGMSFMSELSRYCINNTAANHPTTSATSKLIVEESSPSTPTVVVMTYLFFAAVLAFNVLLYFFITNMSTFEQIIDRDNALDVVRNNRQRRLMATSNRTHG
ncbi:putative membrane protein [Candidatus Ichthyocystis hellenicum]|uniref:Putative membrane protein n=1 Tax=Candidatus Ichthyocystis hellenicum TaxID=1561003 RepID=A0A0S4M6G8_9BURK|nr:putative membrane protein [Candidatus Ichthyocystis hellenicum]